MDPKAVVTVLFLHDIPVRYGSADDNYALFREAVQDNLSKFGKILNCAINKDKYDYFLGTGMVTLDCTVPDEADPLPELTHLIPWYSAILDDTCDVKATWSTMKPYCRYCHEDGHARVDCPKRKQLIQCFNCNEHGHIARVCPRGIRPIRKSKANKPKTQPAAEQQQDSETPAEDVEVTDAPTEVASVAAISTEVTMTEISPQEDIPNSEVSQNLIEASTQQINSSSTAEANPQSEVPAPTPTPTSASPSLEVPSKNPTEEISKQISESAGTEVTIIDSDDEGAEGSQLSVATTSSAPPTTASTSNHRIKKPRSPLSPEHVTKATSKKDQKRRALESDVKTRSNDFGKHNIDVGYEVDLSLGNTTKQVAQHKPTTNDDGSSISQ